MRQTNRCRAAPLVAALAVLAATASGACSLEPPDAARIKQMMAREIGHRLGLAPGQFPVSAITAPRLHSPYALDSLCHGLGALHHSAGFRHVRPWRVGPVLPPGAPSPEAAVQVRAPAHSAAALARAAEFAPAGHMAPYSTCMYEGVAVVLGYDHSSPVAVHFKRRCQ